VDIYNGFSNVWTTSSLSQARAYLAATSIGNIALFAGGLTTSVSKNTKITTYIA